MLPPGRHKARGAPPTRAPAHGLKDDQSSKHPGRGHVPIVVPHAARGGSCLAQWPGAGGAEHHPNGLLDPLVVAALLEPTPRFLAKSTLWKVGLLRPFLAIFEAIPVARAQDTSDSESRAKATANAFAAVHQAFQDGQCVGLFPEGISHGNAALAHLKTGAARMALSGPVKPALVPAGLVYGQRDLFRHNVLLCLGETIEYGDLFSMGDDPAAVKDLTERIRQALLPLTLHGPEEALQRLAEDLAWLRVWIRKAILHPMTALFIALPPLGRGIGDP